MPSFQYRTAALTDKGNVRSINQDSVLDLRRKCGDKDAILLAVADGMGGLEHGEKASGLMTALLTDWWNNDLGAYLAEDADFIDIGNSLTSVIYHAHITLTDSADKNGLCGTTVSLVFLLGDRYLACHAGDSRIYRLCGGKLIQLTTDDTWVHYALMNGEIAQDEVDGHENQHALVNAVGIGEELDVQQYEGTSGEFDALLICSDGLYGELSSETMEKILSKRGSVQKKAKELMLCAMSGKARDNISVVLLEPRNRLLFAK